MKKHILIIAVLFLGIFSTQAQTTHLVTNIANAGAGSLRQAVINATANDIVRLDPSLIAGGSDTIILFSEIAFSKSLVFKGIYNSTDTLYISGNNTNRIFNITFAGNITLDSMVLVNGSSSYGGAIYIRDSDSLFVTNATIRNNSATNDGGGICSYTNPNTSSVTVVNSTISNNSATNNGGGVYSSSDFFPSSVTVTSSTITNNSATNDGGGVYSISSASFASSFASSVTVTSSTIANNFTTNNGGGIYSKSTTSSYFSSVTVINSTVNNNSATSGGGIYSESQIIPSSLQIAGSIIWTASGSGTNIFNSALPISSAGYNIFSDVPTGATGTGDQTNITALSLNLQALANNGGTTATMLPGAGSVALNAGNPIDLNDAQNGPIFGIREIGATESCNDYNTDVQTACNSYTWIDGNTYTSSNNTATQTLTNAAGCDSVVTLDLTINNNNTGTDTRIECDAYTWIDGNTYTANNNTAMFTLTNFGGCDSVVALDLTINNSNTGTDARTACDSYAWIDGNTYTSNNNTATFTTTNAVGCDSVVTLDLTINNSSTATDTQLACDSYTWIDGNTYTSNNTTATIILTNVAGCDSVVTLDLTINNSNTGTDTRIECDAYTWIDGNTYTTNNNTAMFTLTNVGGCDSVVTLDLIINSSSTSTDTQVACDTYTWIDGNTYTSNNNTATQTLTNAAGCDSIVTLDLTINNSSAIIDTHVACNTFTWIDGIVYTSSNNTATQTFTNAVGCDSVVTLDLTINFSTTAIDTVFACDSLTWINGITYTADNDTAMFTLISATGCDSVVTINLTIGALDTTLTQSNDTLIANQSGATYQWIDCGNTLLVGDTNQSYIATVNGNYAVIITNNGCTDTSACYTVTGVGVMENNFKNELVIFPNPTEGNFSIDLGQNYKNITVTITDLSGRIVQSKTYNKSQLLKLNLEEPAGVYILNIQTANNNAVIRLVKE